MNTDSLVARCGNRREDDPEVVDLDVPRLLRRLLLFETYTLDCALRLRDIIALARTVGIDPACELLESGGLRLNMQQSFMAFPNADAVHYPLRFHFLRTQIADEATHARTSYAELTRVEGFKNRKRQKLADLAQSVLARPRAGIVEGVAAQEQFIAELNRNDPALRRGVEAAIQRQGLEVPAEFDLWVEFDGGAHVVSTDLDEKLQLPRPALHNLVGRGLAALAELDLRFEKMERFSAVAAFHPEDFGMMEAKLRQLVEGIDPSVRENQFTRLLNLADLPTFEDIDLAKIDLAKFIDLRNSREMREFRAWLAHGAAASSDAEIEERIQDVRSRIALAVESKAGRGVRLAVTTGVGLIPVAGSVVGAALSAIDEFAVERVIGEPGPVAFFVAKYPSILDR